MPRIIQGLASKLLLLALLGVTLTRAATSKCYALALSSGDESAAYQAGVLAGLVGGLSPDLVNYAAVSGVQGGAINGALFSSFPQGQEQQAADRLKQFWQDAAQTTLYKSWAGSLPEGLFFKGGLYDSAPLKTFLTKEFTGVSMSRSVNVGIVDVLSGEFIDYQENNMTSSNIIDVMYASFALPAFFPPVEAFGSQYFDGSAVWDIDIFSAVNKCLQQTGGSQADVVVDVILTSGANLKKVQAEDYKSIGMLFRYLEISSYYNSMDGLLRAKFAYPNVNFRYVIAPTQSLPSSTYPLDLTLDQINQIIALGVSDAQNAIATGSAAHLDNLIHYHSLKTSGDERISTMTLGDFLEAKAAGTFEQYAMQADTAFIKEKLIQ